jgi:hypothetical protein
MVVIITWVIGLRHKLRITLTIQENDRDRVKLPELEIAQITKRLGHPLCPHSTICSLKKEAIR